MPKFFDLHKYLLSNDIGNYTLARVDVISPYLSVEFFKYLISFNPKSIYITTDISCSDEEIERIRQVIPKDTPINKTICDGIVHMKFYAFHWKMKQSNAFKRILVWGSANATVGGFSKNSEIISWVDISNKETSKKIRVFFDSIKNKKNINHSEHVTIGSLNILLPSVQFANPLTPTFESWLQTGKICQQFPADSNFRHFKIKLKTPIESSDALTKKLSQYNIETTHQSTISYDYIRKLPSAPENISLSSYEDEDNAHNWRAKYFIHTILGYWTSKSCYQEKKTEFRKSNHEIRRQEINNIRNSTIEQQEKWITDFLDILELIFKETPNASNFLHSIKKKGVVYLDRMKYHEILRSQMLADIMRSNDKWFRESYISGFSFVDLPQIREQSRTWEMLLASFSESLTFQTKKQRVQNKLARVFNTHLRCNEDEIQLAHHKIMANWDKFRAEFLNFHNKL